jgi:hypothetical protein
MSWKCVTCDRVFDTIPEDAVLVGRATRSQVTVYKIAGEVHSLRAIKPMSEASHHHWHRNKPKIGCKFCFPPSKPPEPQPPVQAELLEEVVAALESLPAPQPEPEIEDEDVESLTPMQMAFRRKRNE